MWRSDGFREEGDETAARVGAATVVATDERNVPMGYLRAFVTVLVVAHHSLIAYPCFVFAMQGAAWLIAFTLRRRAWLLAVALGWFVSTILLGAMIGSATYNLVAALSLLLLMALPGFVMVRLSRTAQ